MQIRDLARSRFVSLTTFRRSGEPVPTAVWVAQDGDAMGLFTGRGTGKLKRLAHTRRVEARPCSRLGRVADDAPAVEGVAEVLDRAEDVARIRGLLARRYGIEYRIVMLIERLSGRDPADRVGIRVTDAAARPGA